MNPKFHLGLCMAGSVSAGAYTAGVIDYLMEALENWEKKRGEKDIPFHEVEIDLLGGSSGGGITAAIAFFAFRDSVKHASIEEDGRTYSADPDQNIFWKTWVELTGNDVFGEMLDASDINDYYIPSAMNATFIDKVAERFKLYVEQLKSNADPGRKTFLSAESELFMTLFNVTGMKYELNSRALGANQQYVSEHRDIAHFRWSNQYENDGRIEISLNNTNNLDTLIQASKATGAFPVGLKARIVERKAKYIWDNPFFQKNKKFNQQSINLGKNITAPEHVYKSLNADGGTSNNEPVELVRELMLEIRLKEENKIMELAKLSVMDDTQKMIEKSKLENYSIIMVDPFPSYDFDIEEPGEKADHILGYSLDLIFAMNSQLQFDAKEAIDAYDKNNYGLHIIAPSRKEAQRPEYAIACGALGGFGGFLSKEYRVHDYFLGRHNCQSFIRKYFVVDADEKENENGKPNENFNCIRSVLEGYKNQEAFDRFCFTDEKGKRWLPIIPDVSLEKPIVVKEFKVDEDTRQVLYDEPNKLLLYKMELPPSDFLEQYRGKLKSRVNKLMRNVYDSSWFVDSIIKVVANKADDRVADAVINRIKKDLMKRKLVKE